MSERAAWAAKGIVHGTLDVLARPWAASDGSGEPTELRGAPGNHPLAWLVLGPPVGGRAMYTRWRFAQAALDLDSEGASVPAAARRVSYAAIGLGYAALTVTAADARLSDGNGPERETESRWWTGLALSLPAGPWLVDAGLVAFGVHCFLNAAYHPSTRREGDWRRGGDRSRTKAAAPAIPYKKAE